MSLKYKLFGTPGSLEEFAHKMNRKGYKQVDIKDSTDYHWYRINTEDGRFGWFYPYNTAADIAMSRGDFYNSTISAGDRIREKKQKNVAAKKIQETFGKYGIQVNNKDSQ